MRSLNRKLLRSKWLIQQRQKPKQFSETVVAALFQDASGAWYSARDISTLFQDAAGTIPVTTLGQSLGLVLDKRNKAYSVTFDGVGDYLSVDNPNTAFGTIAGDFTVQGWVYWNEVPPGNGSGLERQLIGQHQWPENTNNWWCFLGVAAGIYVYIANGGAYDLIQTTGFSWSANQWYHFAVVRTGSTVKIYIDGVLKGSGTSTKTLMPNNDRKLTIGADNIGAQVRMNGNLFGVSISKTAEYTANFTPQTAVPEVLASTVLLTCGTSWSGNPIITANGDARASGKTPISGLPGNHAYQTNSNYRPIYKLGVASGKPCIGFNGSNQFLVTETIDFSTTNVISVFSSARKLSDVATGVLIESYDSTNTTARAFSVYAPNASTNNYALQSWKDASNHLLAVATGYSAPNTATIAANIKF